jgi:hypothetical protein
MIEYGEGLPHHQEPRILTVPNQLQRHAGRWPKYDMLPASLHLRPFDLESGR